MYNDIQYLAASTYVYFRTLRIKKKYEETSNILRKDQIFLACILERYTMSILREPLTHWDRLGPTGKYQQERLAASGTYISVMCTLTKKPYSFMVHWPRPASSHSIFSFFFWPLSCCSSTLSGSRKYLITASLMNLLSVFREIFRNFVNNATLRDY